MAHNDTQACAHCALMHFPYNLDRLSVTNLHISLQSAQALHLDQPLTADDRQAYQQLLTGPAVHRRDLAESLISEALTRVRWHRQGLHSQDSAPPESPEQLYEWILRQTQRVHAAFADYLTGRRQGASRQYFPTRAHALLFLQRVAPTKLVDGAWLQQIPRWWRDSRLAGLIQIYLDELGNGDPQQNHVALYEQLLRQQGLDASQELPAAFYTQGLVQLALGHLPSNYLPEVAGFNLGYEQLPLHLLITAHELDELGIDPYYFSLHVTVDNGASGHARQAAAAVQQILPMMEGRNQIYQQVLDGTYLNDLGMSTPQIIAGLDLDAAARDILQHKAIFGHQAHADRCRIKGRSVNDWLKTPESTDEFITVMTQTGWIKRHDNPEQSRFWQLISGVQPIMHGVFSESELVILHDWIAGEWHQHEQAPKVQSYHRQNGIVRRVEKSSESLDHLPWDPERDQVERILSSNQTTAHQLDALVPYLQIGLHQRPAGMLATRAWRDRFQ